ncbi:MAG: hypothetical protein Harvfovirus1_78 [Harvfovirus sp.]|uniref:Uncharacterized protein n=1 Tax=Harvfovirus sp. TaxID=2487768 RepID=A0A3G5A3P8_9VIRU|nr:MAG: hypothetical protein Harvfovirus1_78 [Harvfovirus sp.]
MSVAAGYELVCYYRYNAFRNQLRFMEAWLKDPSQMGNVANLSQKYFEKHSGATTRMISIRINKWARMQKRFNDLSLQLPNVYHSWKVKSDQADQKKAPDEPAVEEIINLDPALAAICASNRSNISDWLKATFV